jgi:sugar O-acyltransferase (sialic acid O-acetyltransferase NeuD family)
MTSTEKTPVIVLGAKGIALAVIEALQAENRICYCLLDDDPALAQQEIELIPILGTTDDETYLKLIGKECEAFIAIENTIQRKKMAQKIAKKYKQDLFALVHQRASVASGAQIGKGCFIDAQAHIGAQVCIDQHSLIQAGAVIDYQAQIGSFVHIGAGAVIGASASIGDEVFIGTGAIVVAGVCVGKNAKIGAGSVVVAPVGEGETVFGNPAKKV